MFEDLLNHKEIGAKQVLLNKEDRAQDQSWNKLNLLCLKRTQSSIKAKALIYLKH